MITVLLIGSINKPGYVEVDESTTFKELVENQGGGMMRKYPRATVMQVGGPLGSIIKGTRINDRISDYCPETVTAYMVAVFGERFCPVDFIRFQTRFLVRELKIDTGHVRAINHAIEDIANGRSDMATLERLRELAAVRHGLSQAEHLMNVIINDVIDLFPDDVVEHAVGHYCHFSICRGLFHGGAPCTNTCPSNMNVPGYIELIKHGRLEDAMTLMKRDNPLSFVCGKVCPAPCESRCRQGDITGVSVAIRQLKRYIADSVINTTEYCDDRLESNGRRVSIVGAGPAGMSAAFYLAKTGYDVTVYEASDRVGGAIATGVPAYRLPYKDVLADYTSLDHLGVRTHLNTRIGSDLPLSELRKTSDAVLLATGRTVGRTFGPKSPKFEAAVKFLWDVKLGVRTSAPARVAIIGGGAVAMDCAMTAVRLGAETHMVALEERDQMLCHEEEIVDAVEDGVSLLNGWSTKDFVMDDDQPRKLVLQRCLRVLDDDGRFAPTFDPEELREIDADLVILAIGQDCDLSYLDDDIQVGERNALILNAALQTSAEGVFAAGDIKAPGLVITAVGQGKKAAISIDHYLGGEGIYFGREIEVPETQLNRLIWDIPRGQIAKLAPEVRNRSFDEVESTFTAEQARCEVDRCMRCDANSAKELYLRMFPEGAGQERGLG